MSPDYYCEHCDVFDYAPHPIECVVKAELGPPENSATEDPEHAYKVRPIRVRLEFNPNDLSIEGVYAGEFSLVSDGVVWGLFRRGHAIERDGADWVMLADGGLERAMVLLARAIDGNWQPEARAPTTGGASGG